MELNVVSSEGNLVRMAVSGHVSRKGWARTSDPFVNVCGDGIYGRTVLLSLAGARYIDSMGVEWLLTSNKRFGSRGGMLVIHSATPIAQQIFKLMRMDLVLRIAEDEPAARTLAEAASKEKQRIAECEQTLVEAVPQEK